MNEVIREARVEDAHAIALAEQDIAQEPGFLCSFPAEINEQKIKQTITTSKKGGYLVAEKDGCIVGHAFLEPLHLQSIRHVVQLTICVHKGH